MRNSARSLANLLDQLHPVAACREAIGQAPSIQDKATASWTCLGLSPENFSSPFLDDSVDYDKALEADNTKPTFTNGVCGGSSWPRACSYWVSLHAMGVRADALNLGTEFFQAIANIFAGGTLFCVGCTQHFILLNGPALSPGFSNLVADTDKLVAH